MHDPAALASASMQHNAAHDRNIVFALQMLDHNQHPTLCRRGPASASQKQKTSQRWQPTDCLLFLLHSSGWWQSHMGGGLLQPVGPSKTCTVLNPCIFIMVIFKGFGYSTVRAGEQNNILAHTGLAHAVTTDVKAPHRYLGQGLTGLKQREPTLSAKQDTPVLQQSEATDALIW